MFNVFGGEKVFQANINCDLHREISFCRILQLSLLFIHWLFMQSEFLLCVDGEK